MRRSRKAGRMPGGVFFTATKAATIDLPIESLTTPDTLRVPLMPSTHRLRDGAPPDMELIVKTGRHVAAGQLIARPRADLTAGARVFAPVSGVIGERTTAETACRVAVPAVEVTPDGHQAEPDTPAADPVEHLPEDPVARLAALGIGIDAEQAALTAKRADGRPERLIVDGLESAPYSTARTRILFERAQDLIAAASAVGEALGVVEIHLVVDRMLKRLVRVLRLKTRRAPVKILPLRNKYPQCHPRLLYHAVTGRNLPLGRTPRDAGAWIIGTGELWDVHRALAERRPPVTQTLTVAGDAVQRPGNYRVPVGMSVDAILRRVGLGHTRARVVMGNALTGATVRSANAVIDRGVEGLYAWTPAAVAQRDPTGCLRCGFCIEVCPVGIDPLAVFNDVELGRPDRVPPRAPSACIECGLCDYVCPAALPLMQAISLARAYNPALEPADDSKPTLRRGQNA